jgi:hypothetical protein
LFGDRLGEHVKELAAKTSDRVVEIWQEFRRSHMKSLDLAERNEGFKAFLDTTAPSRLPRLDEIVGLVIAAEGESGLLQRLGNGTLNMAVNTSPAEAIDIARDSRSLETGLKWAAISGDMLAKIVSLELHRRASPDDYTKVTLSQLLALDDKLAITRLASLKPDARLSLFELGASELKGLARALPEGELVALAGYLTGLEKAPRELVLRAVAATPAKMKLLASAQTRDAVIASRDQITAVGMLLRSGADSPVDIAADIRTAWDGKISPILLWVKHPTVAVMAVIPLLVLLLLLRRIFVPRRRKPTAPPAQAA